MAEDVSCPQGLQRKIRILQEERCSHREDTGLLEGKEDQERVQAAGLVDKISMCGGRCG